MLHTLCETEKRFLQSYRKICKEVIVNPLKSRMRLLLNGENQITLNHVRYLLCFPFKDDIIPILHTFFDLNIKCFGVVDDLATLAMRAVRCVYLSAPSTLVAVCLHLHLHAESDLYLLHHNTLPVALRALLCLAVLGPSPPALGTVYVSCDTHVSA